MTFETLGLSPALLRAPDAASGTVHLTPRGETSWHGFAEAIFDEALALGLVARAPRVVAITTADYPTRARRPAYSRLDIGKLERHLGYAMPDWRDGLRKVLAG